MLILKILRVLKYIISELTDFDCVLRRKSHKSSIGRLKDSEEHFCLNLLRTLKTVFSDVTVCPEKIYSSIDRAEGIESTIFGNEFRRDCLKSMT